MPAKKYTRRHDRWERSGGADTYSSGGRADHDPRHIDIFDGKNRLLGRVALPDYKPLDDWIPPRKVVAILNSLQTEGRL